MSARDVNQLIKLLPKLSPSELQQIHGRTEFLITSRSKQKRLDSNDEEHFYDSIVTVLRQAGITSVPPFSVFRRQSYYGYYHEKFGVIDKFVEEYFPDISKVQKLKLYMTLARIIVAQMRKQNLPLGMGIICKNLHRVYELFDEAFPGYMQAGLMGLIIGAKPRKFVRTAR